MKSQPSLTSGLYLFHIISFGWWKIGRKEFASFFFFFKYYLYFLLWRYFVIKFWHHSVAYIRFLLHNLGMLLAFYAMILPLSHFVCLLVHLGMSQNTCPFWKVNWDSSHNLFFFSLTLTSFEKSVLLFHLLYLSLN